MFSSMKTISKVLVIYLLTISLVDGGILDYFKSLNFLAAESESHEATEGFDNKIPYEVSVPDEKFISQAIKLTGIVKSELDTCQHRVVLKLRTDCQSMNDEMISKLAVALLNCQSYVEGRKIYPCSDQMSIKDCTKNMDADAWNSYHLMSNRARAVCYSIRQSQFRGLTEHTVNRLMHAAQDQINTLGKIAQDQENIQTIAQNTLQSVSAGQAELVEQQKHLQKAQFYGQMAIENNIKRLGDEKKMIIQSQKQLAQMTMSMKEKLEAAAQQLEDQASETDNNHKALIEDLFKIQEKANFIFEKIEDSSKLLIKQSEMAQDQYRSTLNQLSEVNATIHSLVTMVSGTKKALEDQLSWISAHLGGTDDALEKMYTILWHIAFLLVGMLACAFLGTRISTRIAVVTVVPLNLALSYYKFEQAQDALTLGLTLAVYILVQTLILSIISLTRRNPKPLAVKPNSSEATPTKLSPIHEDNLDETRINATIHSLVSMVSGTKRALEDQLSWISAHLGGTDDALEKMYTILWHIAFLLVGMLACIFLRTMISTRIAVVTVVPLNLALSYKLEQGQDTLTLGLTLAVYILVQTLILSIISLTRRNPKPLAVKPNSSEATPTKLSPIHEDNLDETRSEYTGYEYSSPLSTLRQRIISNENISIHNSYNNSPEEDKYVSPTPPMSRSGYYLNRSRSRTPMSLNLSGKTNCLANTRQGTPCKLSAVVGREYCHRHQKGDSVMG